MKKIIIFIVEDEQITSAFIKNELTKHFDCELYQFDSVERSLSRIELKPDYIILDHFLNKVNGIECIPIYREFSPESKIIVHTSQSNIEMFEHALLSGADEYIVKSKYSLADVSAYIQKDSTEKTNWDFNWFNRLFKSKKERKKKVYIVEDNKVYNFAIAKNLSEGDYNIETYFDADSLMKQISHFPDVVVLDYNLGGGANGYEVLKEIKIKSPATKVIILSGQQDVEVASLLIKGGADFYITKSSDAIDKLFKILEAL